MRVLVADDERVLAETVAEGLRGLALAVDVVYDGSSALDRVLTNAYEVVVLDRDMPGLSGDAVCRHIIESGRDTRVLMLTAAAGIRERVEGLNLGADDYLIKPFAFAELVARVQALGRRPGKGITPVLQHSGLVMDTGQHTVTREGLPLTLTPKEFSVLRVLLRAGGAVVSAEELLEQAWDENANPFTNSVRVTVMKLRKKLGDPPLIHTVSRIGYRLGP
uniref:response regulator transcription factor n=1 Tax=Paractinoplanes polyasparticus TaxID=2856853 RepID=UPI001C84B8C3|nr:response regulator transcription factor [Actinoplanes polyasparticus]